MEEKRLYSPTLINTYFRCPRLYYYRYIKNIPTEPSIHLYKGSLVHEILEDIFKQKKFINLKIETLKMLNSKWNPSGEGIQLPNEELKNHKKEVELMLQNFSVMFNNKVNLAILDKKVIGKDHAWNLLRPHMREYDIIDEGLQLRGIIDTIEKDFDDRVFLVDYKTSKKYHDLVPQEYIRQIGFYALLYKRKFGQLPDYIGINYLRYGETYFFPVCEAMVEESMRTLEFVKRNTQSTDIKDYPLEGDKFGVLECQEIEKKLLNKN